MAKPTEVKERVQRYLAGTFRGVMIDADGDYSFRLDSARVFVRVVEWVNEQTAVRIFAPVLFDVPLTQEVKDYVALEGGRFPFGHMTLFVSDDGRKAQLQFAHTILGDYLDEPELINSCMSVGAVAERLDDELKARFGGRRFYEDD